MLSRLLHLLRKVQSIAVNANRVKSGFSNLKAAKQTPHASYAAMRDLFVQTNGRSNDLISTMIKKKPFKNIPIQGILGIECRADLLSAVNSMRQNGYYVFDAKLPIEMIQGIYHYATTTPCRYLETGTGRIGYADNMTTFDERNIISPRYQFSQEQIAANEVLQKLIFDTSLLAFAQEYLATRPVLDLVAMWWSAPFNGEGKSEAAQMYHFDLDRIKFMKFFFYLTDVDTETGPHCYVKGSHRRLPSSLLRDGRFTDEEVSAAFGKDKLVELCGRKGTIMAVDTRGLHKGKELTRDKRLLFQIEFSNSMFGQYYPRIAKPALKDEVDKVYSEYKEAYNELIQTS